MTLAVVRDGHPLEAPEGEVKEAGDEGIARGTPLSSLMVI